MIAANHLHDVLKLAAGGGIAAIVGYFGAGEINTARDVEGLQHDVAHHERIVTSFASDFTEVRKALQDIDVHLATVAGTEGALQVDLSDMKRSIEEVLRSSGVASGVRSRGQ